MIRWHQHHIVPKHMGGTDDPSNLLKCNVAMHAFLHKQLYVEHGCWQDLVAWQGLTGQIGKDEILHIKNVESGRMGGLKVGKMLFENRLGIFAKGKIGQGMKGRKHTPETKELMKKLALGPNNSRYGQTLSEETKQKISLAKLGVKQSLEERQNKSLRQLGKKRGKYKTKAADVD